MIDEYGESSENYDEGSIIKNLASGEFETTVTIMNELGLHARPAALVAQTAQKFSADVKLIAANRHADAKSILDILSLAAAKGTTITIKGKGSDAKQCITHIAGLVRMQFLEESA